MNGRSSDYDNVIMTYLDSKLENILIIDQASELVPPVVLSGSTVWVGVTMPESGWARFEFMCPSSKCQQSKTLRVCRRLYYMYHILTRGKLQAHLVE